jgi:DNA-binding response OmpR family regulator
MVLTTWADDGAIEIDSTSMTLLQPPTQRTILVVDDEETLRDMLGYNLRREGFNVLTAADGVEALRLAFDERPDLIILDIMLPGMSGFDVCRAVRRQLTVPILMLSAREEEIDKVLGLELGADDYLTKPFSLRELMARVGAMLRRADILHVQAAAEANTASPVTVPQLEPARSASGNTTSLATADRLNQGPPQAELSPPPALVSGDLVIDTARRTVSKGGQPVALKPKEFDLLAFLVSHPLQVFSREVLLDRVWGYDFVGGARTVDVHIRWLRSKIEPNPDVPEYILTVYGVGYKFNQAVKTKG